ncbi:lysis system i-spanin subunit Rz [Stutzerimonas stutzeri]
MIALLKQYKLIAAGAAVLTLMALSAAGAWQWQGNAYGKRLADQATAHETFLRQVAEANAAVILKQQAERLDLEGRLAASDQQRYGELRHAQQEIERLSAAVADGTRRLSVRASCPASAGSVSASTGAGRLDDGGQRADIHEEDARRIVAITGDADACAMKLTALQEWAREVTKGN